MDNGELEFASNPDEMFDDGVEQQLQSSCSMDSFFDEILKDTHACTHTHTCNPPGPDLSHTHTCFHAHTKILSSSPPNTDETTDSYAEKGGPSSKKRPFGNREAVRKYREKKKARAASLEDEVVQLREINQQLMKRLQGQTALEAEVMRLRCLLVDIRGRIEGEIGSFPYQKPAKGGGGDFITSMSQTNLPSSAHVLSSCDLCCDDQGYCLQTGMQGKNVADDDGVNGQVFGVCGVGTAQCMGGLSSGSKDFLNCGRGNALLTGCTSSASRGKGVCESTKG